MDDLVDLLGELRIDRGDDRLDRLDRIVRNQRGSRQGLFRQGAHRTLDVVASAFALRLEIPFEQFLELADFFCCACGSGCLVGCFRH